MHIIWLYPKEEAGSKMGKYRRGKRRKHRSNLIPNYESHFLFLCYGNTSLLSWSNSKQYFLEWCRKSQIAQLLLLPSHYRNWRHITIWGKSTNIAAFYLPFLSIPKSTQGEWRNRYASNFWRRGIFGLNILLQSNFHLIFVSDDCQLPLKVCYLIKVFCCLLIFYVLLVLLMTEKINHDR